MYVSVNYKCRCNMYTHVYINIFRIFVYSSRSWKKRGGDPLHQLESGFEDQAKKAKDKVKLGVEALEEVMKGLSTESPMELAISTLGNLCLAGSTLNYFQSQSLGKFN